MLRKVVLRSGEYPVPIGELMIIPQSIINQASTLQKAVEAWLKVEGNLYEGEAVSLKAVILRSRMARETITLDSGENGTFHPPGGGACFERELSAEELALIQGLSWEEWQKVIISQLLSQNNAPIETGELVKQAITAGLRRGRNDPRWKVIGSINTVLRENKAPFRFVQARKGTSQKREYRFYRVSDNETNE